VDVLPDEPPENKTAHAPSIKSQLRWYNRTEMLIPLAFLIVFSGFSQVVQRLLNFVASELLYASGYSLVGLTNILVLPVLFNLLFFAGASALHHKTGPRQYFTARNFLINAALTICAFIYRYCSVAFINSFFDDDRGFAHDATRILFEEIAAGKYEAFTSGAVIEELSRAPSEKYTAMFALIEKYNISVLSVSEEAEALADIYVSEGIIPLKYRTDGVHIAVATENEIDIILSMNFQHIVKLKTIRMTSAINILRGYSRIEIASPMEVVENESN
jgi:predicted nucleic acid-binding protein